MFFSDLIKDEIKRTHVSVENVFLMIKIGPGFMDLIFYYFIKLWWH
jgi:hypothetical protein